MSDKKTAPLSAHDPRLWKRTSPATPGLHAVATPDNSPFRSSHIFRLNLPAGQSHTLEMPGLELVAGVIAGAVRLENGNRRDDLAKCDTFYLPGGQKARITATADVVLYIGGAVYEGIGSYHVRRLDLSLPIGAIHQVHGKPPFEREVFLSLDPATPASRLMAGFTWGAPGGWTSWPPHQHEKDLEETYWYFDIPVNQSAFHICYNIGQTIADAVVHPVASGDLGMAPAGYHPTVAHPGARSSYFWILAAHSHASRRYDLNVNDPRLG